MDSARLFSQLDTLLLQSRMLWQLRSFNCKNLPWQSQFPRLAALVWSLDDELLDDIDRDQTRLQAILLPALTQDLLGGNAAEDKTGWNLNLFDTKITNIKRDTDYHFISESEIGHFSAHIKGRKWQQICAFTQCLEIGNARTQLHPKLAKNLKSALPVIEWCAGKGHLGRLIAKVHDTKVTSLEWQSALCHAGETFAARWQLPQTFVCEDAFNLKSSPFAAEQHAVALHACGDLHINLLRLASSAKTRRISFSPCCYHLIQAEDYQALSKLGQSSALKLTRHDLQLPLQQSVIASPRQQRLRHQEMAWRLGFDSLQREIRGCDEYLPLPSLKQSQLSGCFKAFCHWGARAKGVEIPLETNLERYMDLGLQRQRLTRRIDLVAHLFRPIVEHWLLYDRVCFLQEQGYQVNIGTFCDSAITPRNVLIQAVQEDN